MPRILRQPLGGEPMDLHADATRLIDAAIARRKELFSLSHLALTTEGCTLKFRSGFVEIVRAGVPQATLTDPASFDRLLDGIRVAFRAYTPLRDPSRRQIQY